MTSKGSDREQLPKYHIGGNHMSQLIFDSSIHTMDHPHFIVCSFIKNNIGLKREKRVGIIWAYCMNRLTITEGLDRGFWYSLFIKNLTHYSSH